MKNYIFYLLKLVGSNFIKFIKRILVFIHVPFGIPFCVSILFSFLISLSLQYIGVTYDICLFICRILLTVMPIIPTCIYALCEQEDRYEEFSMDLCFVVWIATIVYAWKIL